MIRSLIISALILIAAALLAWREKQQLSVEKETNETILRQIANDPSIDPQSPINIERRKAQRAKQEKVKTITCDFFALYGIAPDDPAAVSGEERLRIEAELKSRLEALDPSEIRLFMEECNKNPDLNAQIRQSLDSFVQRVFIVNYPLEMTRMMTQSPKQFGIGEGKNYDSFSHLVYYYSSEKRDLQTLFECLSEAPPEFQAKYIGGAVQFGTGSPSQRAELLEEMRYFAASPEQQELVKSKLSDLAFARPDAKGSFVELTDWIGSANLSSEELVAATKGMEQKVRVGETGPWLDWLAKNDIPDEEAKQRAYELASRWTDRDYQAVGQWLNRSPDSPEKAAVASAYAAKTYPYDPVGATQWLQTIPPGPDRTKALNTIYQAMPKDSDEAKAFASQFGLGK
ncbi:MAG: hypothetical protein ACOVRB_01660 [Akkermansiaceae bacterium]